MTATTDTAMIDAKGAEYVASFPTTIAVQAGLSPEYVIRAYNELHGTDHPERDGFRDDALDYIAALTPAEAKALVGRVREISRQITRDQRGRCWCCGLTTGTCGC